MVRRTVRVGSMAAVLAVTLGGSVAGAGAQGCSKKSDAPPDPPAPAAAPLAASTAMASAHSVDFTIDAASKAAIDMPAPKERIKGEATAAKGILHIDMSDLAMTRGDVYIDLDTFSTHTF